MANEQHSEVWRPIPGFGGHYEASSMGTVRRLTACRRSAVGTVIIGSVNPRGYRKIRLCHGEETKVFFVHKIIAMVFIGPKPDGREINHKDGDPGNNAADNLEYVTRSENLIHAMRVLGRRIGETAPNAKLTTDDVLLIREKYANGTGLSDLGREFGVSHAGIWKITTRRNWRHV